MPLSSRPHPISIVSALNSTITPLGASATFTGTAEEVKDYAVISVFVFSDQDSAALGLKIEWSQDGTNWDSNDEFSYAPTNSSNKLYSFGPSAQYFRVSYTNGTTPQGAFRLQTIFHPFHAKSSSHRIGDTISQEADAELIKAVISGQHNGTFENVKTDNGRLKTAATPNVEIEAENGNLYTAIHTENVSTTEETLMLVRNPAGSGKVIVLTQLIPAVQADATDPIILRLYAAPTVTSTGTGITERNTNVGSSNVTVATLFSDPTTSSFGGLLSAITFNRDNGPSLDLDGKYQIQPGQDVLITGQGFGTTQTWTVTLMFYERNS